MTEREVIDAGVSPRGKNPERTCIVTRAEHPVGDLIRFVVGPDMDVVPDLAARLPGRGAWLVCDRATVDTAIKSKSFPKSFKQQVKVRADLAEFVETLLARRAAETLSLANKAGLVVTGYSKVEAMLASGKAVILMHASDAADDGCEKLDRLFKAVCRDTGRSPRVMRVFDLLQMSLALGRSHVVHACLSGGGGTDRLDADVQRLLRYRGASDPNVERYAPDIPGATEG
jgi:predicted RNA-binding protein YlxR (DUF448 family)